MQRKSLERGIKLLSAIFGLAVLFVMFDFMIDFRPSTVHSSYQFNLPEMTPDQPEYLAQDNLAIVVIQRSESAISALEQSSLKLQDAISSDSIQPEYARNTLRSRTPVYYVSYARGTDLGCTLKTLENIMQEVCGKASYDFAGRALAGSSRFKNLAIPDYIFTNNFKTLTIKP